MQVVVGWSVRCIIVWSQQAARTENSGNGRRGRKTAQKCPAKGDGRRRDVLRPRDPGRRGWCLIQCRVSQAWQVRHQPEFRMEAAADGGSFFLYCIDSSAFEQGPGPFCSLSGS